MTATAIGKFTSPLPRTAPSFPAMYSRNFRESLLAVTRRIIPKTNAASANGSSIQKSFMSYAAVIPTNAAMSTISTTIAAWRRSIFFFIRENTSFPPQNTFFCVPQPAQRQIYILYYNKLQRNLQPFCLYFYSNNAQSPDEIRRGFALYYIAICIILSNLYQKYRIKRTFVTKAFPLRHECPRKPLPCCGRRPQ